MEKLRIGIRGVDFEASWPDVFSLTFDEPGRVNSNSGRDCYDRRIRAVVPSSGVAVIARGETVLRSVAYSLTEAASPGDAPRWSQINAAADPEVVQLFWRPDAEGVATLERVVVQVRPAPLFASERDQVLAL